MGVSESEHSRGCRRRHALRGNSVEVGGNVGLQVDDFSRVFRSFVAPAIAAEKAGRPQLAQQLLRHERNAGDRVMALLALRQWAPAVLAAELAHDCDLGAIVAIRMKEAVAAGELAGEDAARALAGNEHVLREYLRLAGNETTMLRMAGKWEFRGDAR